MKSRLFIFSMAAALLITTFNGCGKKEDSASATAPVQTDNFVISPGDKTQNVRLDSQIILSFAKPVDAKVVENGFHLISQGAMADSTCSFSKTMNHGQMDIAMMDSMKMNHLDINHSVKGSFSWNLNNTQCVFSPDSMMTPKMAYMIHIDKNMVDMMNQKMGNMGSMMGGGVMMDGTGQMAGHMLMHFTTMDTAKSSGGGHLGHH